jgi:hypothetical protein
MRQRSEDPRDAVYEHHAVNAHAIAEAIAKNLVSSELEGRLKLIDAAQ